VENAAAYTIDELADRAGVTPRNIRAYQSRGLLSPPVMRGRVGYYDDEHLVRLRLIQTLQDDGFNLAAIAAVFAAGPGEAERMHRISPPALDRMAVGLQAELSEEGHAALESVGDDLVESLVSNGVIRRLPSGQYAAASPALLAAARQLLDHGVSQVDQVHLIGELAEVARRSAHETVHFVMRLMHRRQSEMLADAAHQFVVETYRAVFNNHLATAVASLADQAER
jgi:DNA-binding transcriptional MerR regulator